MLEGLSRKLRSTGYDDSVLQWLMIRGMAALLISAVLTFIVYFVFYIETQLTVERIITLLTIFLALFLFVLFFQVIGVYQESEKRRREIELILPDFLLLVSSNLRAKMSPMLALKTAARKEFGALSDEINYVTVKSLGTESFIEQLILIPKRLNSELIERIMMLFITGHISGGDLASLLERIAYDIRETEQMRRRLYMGVNIYILFIMVSLLIGMPLLFAAAGKFVEMSAALSETVIDTRMLFILFMCMLGVTSVLTGIFSAVIKGEHKLGGLARGIGYAIITIILFNVFSYLIGVGI